MKKKVGLYIIVCVILILCLCALYFKANQYNNVSYSEKNNNAYTQNIIAVYSEKYSHKFELASVETENKLFGIWQAKEFVGGDSSREIYWDGLYGDIVIFSEDTWVYNGSPRYQPVYACYAADFEEIKNDLYLNIAWKDDRYDECNAIVGIAISSEENNSMGSTQERTLKFIIIGNDVIIEANESYFRLEKVGEIELNDLFENVKPK